MKKTLAVGLLCGAMLFCGCSAPQLKYYEGEEETGYTATFYRPQEGALADVIPYYEDGTFYLYYLRDYRNVEKYGTGVDWNLISTQDFVTYREHGTVIKRGSPSQQDNCVYTGGIVKDQNQVYHIFYTGHNAAYIGSGKPQEAIMHAVSHDKLNWKKVPEDTFYAPEGYMADDWRDPFVYYDADSGLYKMLLAARVDSGFENARGVTAVFESENLTQWTQAQPLFAPQRYHTHECPDLFKMGDWWYLIFSEFSDRVCTRYVMSTDLQNWTAPRDDMFDGRAFYAAKSAGDENHRYLFGWVPTKQQGSDSGGWEWGGSLAVHEIYQQEDGTLGVCPPKTVADSFLQMQEGDTVTVKGTSGKSTAVGQLPERCKITCTVTGDFHRAGIAVDHQATKGYRYIIDKKNNRFTFENYPSNNLFQDVTVPISAADAYELTLFIEGSVLTAYINGEKALSVRVAGAVGNAALYAEGGEAEFDYAVYTA